MKHCSHCSGFGGGSIGYALVSTAALFAFLGRSYYFNPPQRLLLPRIRGNLLAEESCFNSSDKFVFATLYTAPTVCYTVALGVLLSSFRAVNSTHKLLVLHASGVQIPFRLLVLGGAAAEFRSLPLITDQVVAPRLRAMATKFQLWALCYNAVAYVDADHVFTLNPDGIFDACRGSTFCAVLDASPSGKRSRQFNAGAMVLRPSRQLAEGLLEAYKVRSSWMNAKEIQRSGDQIFLNHEIHNWRALPSTFNAQHGEKGIIIHDKVWKNKSGSFVHVAEHPYISQLLSECRRAEEGGNRRI